MSGKFYNLDTRNTLGGDGASDFYVASQKAVKDYVDTAISTLQVVNTEYLKDLKDVNLETLANGQSLVYDSTSGKWVNIAIDTSVATWGKITGSMTAQTDLTTALNGKANITHTHTKSQITDLVLPSALSDLTDDLGSSPVHTHSQYLTEHQDISGKQDIITSDNQLSSDLVTDIGKTHKFVTAAQMSTWNDKQDAITDLETIRTLATSALQSGDNVSSLINDAGYLTSEDISSVFVYKGTKATVDALPVTGNKKGDVWTVSTTGAEYVWNGSAWEYLGQVLDLSGYQTKLSITNKLNADYIQDGTTNRVVTQSEKDTWSGKQDALTQIQLTNIDLGGTALQPNDNISELVNDAGYITGVAWEDIEDKPSTFTPSSHSHTSANITDLNTTISNAIAGKANTDDLAEVAFTGDYKDLINQPTIPTIPTNVSAFVNDAGYLTEHQDISGKQDIIDTTHKLSADLVDDSTSTNKFVTAANKTTWNNKQDAISDLITIRANATAGAEAATTIAGYGDIVTHDADEFLTEHQDISGKADKATTLAGYGITDAYNKSQIDGMVSAGMHYKGTKASASELPTSGNQIGDLWNVTDTGANYAWNGTEWDKLSENIDLSGYQTLLSSTNTLNPAFIAQDNTHKFVSDTEKTTWNNKQSAISDLATIRANATAGKGAADTIANYGDIVSHDADEFAGATHIHAISDVTDLQTTLNGKQTTINDLETIRTNAASGANAATTIASYGNIVTHDADEFANATHSHVISDVSELQDALDGKANTSHTHGIADVSGLQTALDGKAPKSHTHTVTDVSGAQAEITTTNKLSADLIADGTTNKVVTATEKSTWNGKQNAISDLATIRANATAGKEAADTISGYGDIVTHNADEFLTEHQSLAGYVPTSRKVNGKALTTDITLSASDVSALPADTEIPTVNNVNITIQRNGTAVGTIKTNQSTPSAINISVPTTYSDVNAASEGHTHTYSDVGAASAAHTHDYVPTSRKVAGKTLTADITLSASDVGALPSNTVIPTVNDGKLVIKKNSTAVGTFTANQTGTIDVDITVPTTYSDVSAASAGHTHSNYVVTTRKIAGHALSADVTLSSTDITDLDTTITTAISGKANTTEVYTKTQIDGKLSGAMHFKGTVASVSALPSTGNTQGDMYNVTDTGANYAWDGSAWDKLSENIDLSGLVPNTRTVNGKTLNTDITLTYSDVGAASSTHTHNYVPTSRKINGKTLNADVTLSYTDVGALSAETVIPTVPTNVSAFTNDVGYLTVHQDLTDYQKTETAVTHIKNTAVGNTITPVYVNASGVATALGYTIAKSVPSDAKFSDTTYTAGTGLSLSGTQFKHSNSVEAGTVGTDTATSGSTLAVPFVTYDAQGHITATGTHTHTVTGFSTEGHTHTKSEITDFPTIPTVNDSGVTIKRNGTTIGSFTLNKSTATNIDITVPTTYTDVGAASAGHTHTYSDVGAASTAHTHSQYAAVTHYHASNSVTVMTGYTKASASAAIATTDSLNTAIGKLEYKIDSASGGGASEIDGISGSTINRYCACSTAAATAAKTANITAGTPTLIAGLRITVKFSNKNTANNPTFNLNSLGAKNIFVDGAQITTGSNKGILNGVLDLVYDGTQWHIVGSTMATVGMMA